jgi:hypothetical protein
MRQKNRTNWIRTGRRKIKRMEKNMRKYEDKRMREKRKETIGNSTKKNSESGKKTNKCTASQLSPRLCSAYVSHPSSQSRPVLLCTVHSLYTLSLVFFSNNLTLNGRFMCTMEGSELMR